MANRAAETASDQARASSEEDLSSTIVANQIPHQWEAANQSAGTE
jgi:hypothetical protein